MIFNLFIFWHIRLLFPGGFQAHVQVQEAETPVLPVLLWDFPGD